MGKKLDKRPRMDKIDKKAGVTSWSRSMVSKGIQLTRAFQNAIRYYRTSEVKRNGETTIRLFSAGRPHGLQSRQDKKGAGETGGGLRLTKEI